MSLRRSLRFSALLLAGWMLAGHVPALAAPVVRVIVNREVGVDQIDRDDLTRIYLGKKTLWDSGQRVAPALLDDSLAISERFLEQVLHKTPSQFRAYWKRQLFSGGGAPPRSFRSSEQVADFVARQPGAIGIVDPGFADQRVKVVQITE